MIDSLSIENMNFHGRFVKLAPVCAEEDINSLYDSGHFSEEAKKIWTYMSYGPFQKKEMFEWLKSIQKRPGEFFYTVTSLEQNKKVGMCALINIDQKMRRAEIGHIWYDVRVHKTKINTETTYLLLKYLFEDLKYRRVEWKCDNENEASKQTALRMGFQYEGLFRQHMMIKNKNRDTAWFAMLDIEWPKRKHNFEIYLTGEAKSLRELNKGIVEKGLKS